MSQENVEMMQRAFDAFNRGDRDAAVADVAPDCEYVASGTIPDATGNYRGTLRRARRPSSRRLPAATDWGTCCYRPATRSTATGVVSRAPFKTSRARKVAPRRQVSAVIEKCRCGLVVCVTRWRAEGNSSGARSTAQADIFEVKHDRIVQLPLAYRRPQPQSRGAVG